jgi:hypothetical protein
MATVTIANRFNKDESYDDLTIKRNLLVIPTATLTSNGVLTSPAANGLTYSGTLDNGVGGATPQTLNTRVGRVTFTGVGDTAAGTDLATPLVINDSLVTSATRGLVNISGQTVAANACFNVKNVAFGTGTITVTLNNGGVATSGAAGVVSLAFDLFN